MTSTLLWLLLLTAFGTEGDQVTSENTASSVIQAGSHLRIYHAATGIPAIEGTASGFENGLLLLHVGSNREPLRLDLNKVSRVEIRTKKSSRGKGAALGSAAGGLGFLLLVAATNGCGGDEFAESFLGISDTECYGSALLVGGAAGALIGLAVSHGDHWKALPLNDARRTVDINTSGFSWQVRVRPGTLGLSLSMGF